MITVTPPDEPRREHLERIRRMLAEEHRLREQHRRAAFDGAVEALLDRVGSDSSTSTPLPDEGPDTHTAPPPGTPEPWWSPTPVLGYRVWDLRDGCLHGAWTRWETSQKTAVCLDPHSRASGPVPHDAAECRHPPCGIYALKTMRRIQVGAERSIRRASIPLTLAIGLVAMTGRVIEHESGYRAQRAEAVALAMVTGGARTQAVLTTVHGDAVAAAFAMPGRFRRLASSTTMITADAVVGAVRFLEEAARVEASW